MDKILLVIIAVLAVSAQSLISVKQASALSSTFSDMNQRGNVLVGKSTKRIKGGAYLLLNIDSNGIVRDMKSISGRTVFAKIKEHPEHINKPLGEIGFDDDRLNRALENARMHYLNHSRL